MNRNANGTRLIRNRTRNSLLNPPRSISGKSGRENADYDQITVNNIGICVLDYNKDGKVNSTDVALFSKFKTDLNGDSEFNEEDFAIFKLFLRHKVAYTQLNLN